MFQRKAEKDAEKANLNKSVPITTPATSIIPPIITTTTTQLKSPFLTSPLKRSSQPEGALIKKDKGKETMSSKDAEEEGVESDSKDDTINLDGSMVESSKKKKMKKFDFVTEGGEHVHFTEEQIKEQKRTEESVKADATKHEIEIRKEEWIDLLGVDVEDGTDEVIPNFKASDLHLSEWRELVKACPNRIGKGWSTIYDQIKTRMDYLYKTKAELGIDLDKPLGEQDPLDKLNDLAKKKIKNVDDIHDYLKANKRLKSSILYEDRPARIMLNELVLGMILLHQGPGIDDLVRTFSSFLHVEVDKRNLNTLKQIRAIEQLRQAEKRLIYIKRNKADLFGNDTSKVGKEVQRLSLKDYAHETAARILNMVPTKKVDETPYEIWHGKESKVFVDRNGQFLESDYLLQEFSRNDKILDENHIAHVSPGLRISNRPSNPLDKYYGFLIDLEGRDLGDHDELDTYNQVIHGHESKKCLEEMNAEMQSMKITKLET
ncbi:hypothetical protein Tco_0103045 [Tanacetum coccineum]